MSPTKQMKKREREPYNKLVNGKPKISILFNKMKKIIKGKMSKSTQQEKVRLKFKSTSKPPTQAIFLQLYI